MELIDNKSQNWQGWNDFLGISKDDTHNYITNLIGDIIDGFNTEAREEELGEVLISDEAKSYLFFSEFVFKYAIRKSDAWMQVLIYKVEKYFIIVKYNFDGVWFCRYVGEDLRLAFDIFQREIESSQSDFKKILDDYIQSEYDLSEKVNLKVEYKDYYLLTGYIIPVVTESYFEYLEGSLTRMQESKTNRSLSN